MYESDMIEYVETLKIIFDKKYDDSNIRINALPIQEIFYEIAITITNFSNKKGGGFGTPFRDIQKGFNDFTHGFMNEINKITNGTGYLILSIYQSIIFDKLNHYTLHDQRNIIIELLIDLVNKYKEHKQFGGRKIKKIKKIKKKGGVAESILITSIIIAAIWALIQMFDNIDAKYQKWKKENQRNSQVFPKLTPEMIKQEPPKKKVTPKKQVNPEKQEQDRKGLFNFRFFRRKKE